MRTETIEIYQFHELSDEAKEKARDWWRSLELESPAWSAENRQALEAFCGIWPVEAVEWRFDCHYFHARTAFTGDGDVCELTGIRLATYLYNNFWRELTVAKRYEKGGQVMHSKIQRVPSSCKNTGYYMDDVLLDPIREFLRLPDRDMNFESLLHDCVWGWARSCRDDLAASMADEAVDETITANEYEFTIDGKHYS